MADEAYKNLRKRVEAKQLARGRASTHRNSNLGSDGRGLAKGLNRHRGETPGAAMRREYNTKNDARRGNVNKAQVVGISADSKWAKRSTRKSAAGKRGTR